MKNLSFFIILILISSCIKKEESKKLSAKLPYEIKIFRIESPGGCKSDTVKCASYEVEYPEFKLSIVTASDSLKKKIAQSIATGNPETDHLSFQQAGQTFIRDFESTKKQFPDQAMGWYFKATVDINLMTDTLITLESNSEYFTGGAHGGYGTYFVNIDPASGRSIALADILKPGFEEALRLAGEKEFRTTFEMNDSTTYSDQGFEFPENKFQLNTNYGFTEKGIKFVYNIYEIGPYVLGSQEVLIPFEKIKPWLKVHAN